MYPIVPTAPAPAPVRFGDRPIGIGLAGRQLGEAEVENLHAVRRRDEQIVRLDVAVHDPLVVRRGERQRNLAAVVDGFLNREVLGVQLVAQRHAFEKLGDEVRRAVVHADVVDRQHARVIECGCRPRFLFEPAQTLAVRWQISPE